MEYIQLSRENYKECERFCNEYLYDMKNLEEGTFNFKLHHKESNRGYSLVMEGDYIIKFNSHDYEVIEDYVFEKLIKILLKHI